MGAVEKDKKAGAIFTKSASERSMIQNFLTV